MANFKLNKWSKRALAAAFGVLCIFGDSAYFAPGASAGPAKAPDEMSFSDALITLKKAEKNKRATGFRKKGRPVTEKPEKEVITSLSISQKGSTEAKGREEKRKKSELDFIKQENRKLEHDIMKIIDEDDQPSFDMDGRGLPDITPPFPGYARLFGDEGYFHGQLNFKTASWVYNDHNKIEDASKLVVGYNPVEIQDILLISRLARMSSKKYKGIWRRSDYEDPPELDNQPQNKVFLIGDTSFSNVASDLEYIAFNNIPEDGNDENVDVDSTEARIAHLRDLQIHNHFLNRIADKKIEFKADTKHMGVDLNYVRTFKEVFSLGLEIPVVLRSNKIKMISEFTQSELDEIASSEVTDQGQTGVFFIRYPAGLKDFFRDILERKGMLARERHTQFGIGDVSFFVNRKIDAPEVTAGLVGLGVTFPSGVKTDKRYIWPAVLGNGGFWEARAHGNLFWRKSGFFNPHIFGELRLRLGSTVERRVSRVVNKKRTRPRDEDGFRAGDLALGSGFVFHPDSLEWKEPESKVPALAANPIRSIEINRGAQFKLRVGNLFNKVFFDKAYLDVFYQVEFEQEDNAGFRQINPEFNIESLTKNSRRHSHTLGAVYCYKWDDNWQIEANLSHVLSGRNALRELQLGAAAQYKF